MSYISTNDLKKRVLERCGELTNGTSKYESRAVQYLDEAHKSIIAGGSEFGLEAKDPWVWAKAKRPITITLMPEYTTGSITVTQDSSSGTLSDAPTVDLNGYYIKIGDDDIWYKIVYQSTTSVTLSSAYLGSSGSYTIKCIKTEYEIFQDLVTGYTGNSNVQETLFAFQDSAGTNFHSTITMGSITYSQLATNIASAMSAASTPDTFTAEFNYYSRKIRIFTQNTSKAAKIIAPTIVNSGKYINKIINFTEGEVSFSSDSTLSTNYIESEVPIQSISRLVTPLRFAQGTFYKHGAQDAGKIFAISEISMDTDYPLTKVTEGYPDKFCIIEQTNDGKIKIRLNKYPVEKVKVEVEYIPTPLTLIDNTYSQPLIPIPFRAAIVHAASYKLMIDKSDNKAQAELDLAKAKLEAMKNEARRTSSLIGKNYGRLIPRRENY